MQWMHNIIDSYKKVSKLSMKKLLRYDFVKNQEYTKNLEYLVYLHPSFNVQYFH
jgi:hypothetical protein